MYFTEIEKRKQNQRGLFQLRDLKLTSVSLLLPLYPKVRSQYECKDDKTFTVALTAAYSFTHMNTIMFFQAFLSLSRFMDFLTQKHFFF